MYIFQSMVQTTLKSDLTWLYYYFSRFVVRRCGEISGRNAYVDLISVCFVCRHESGFKVPYRKFQIGSIMFYLLCRSFAILCLGIWGYKKFIWCVTVLPKRIRGFMDKSNRFAKFALNTKKLVIHKWDQQIK